MLLKKILSTLCAFLLLVSVMCACNDNEGTESKASSTVSTQSENKIVGIDPDIPEDSKYNPATWNPYASMPESCKGTTIRVASWSDSDDDSDLYTRTNMYNDIGLKYELFSVPQAGYVNNIMTKIASGDIPDVFTTNEGDGAFPVTLQIAAPINKVSSVDLNDPRWDPTYLAGATIDGNTYFVQTIGSPVSNGNLVFFNKRLFRENGFTTPAEHYENGTWSWDNLLKCAKDIKSLGSEYRGISLEMDILAGSVNTSITKYDFNSKRFINNVGDPVLLKAYQWYADAKEQNLLDGTLGSFIEGKCAIFVRGPFGLAINGYFKDMDPNDIGFTWLPSFEEGVKGRVSSIYGGRGIVTGAPNAEAAGYFLRYYMDYHNWDLENIFLTTEAGNFYYDIVETLAENKYFNFDDPLCYLTGSSANKEFYSHLNGISGAGIKTALDSISNTVDAAVTKGNELIANKIEDDRKKYN